jgi:hypothetical protein
LRTFSKTIRCKWLSWPWAELCALAAFANDSVHFETGQTCGALFVVRYSRLQAARSNHAHEGAAAVAAGHSGSHRRGRFERRASDSFAVQSRDWKRAGYPKYQDCVPIFMTLLYKDKAARRSNSPPDTGPESDDPHAQRAVLAAQTARDVISTIHLDDQVQATQAIIGGILHDSQFPTRSFNILTRLVVTASRKTVVSRRRCVCECTSVGILIRVKVD